MQYPALAFIALLGVTTPSQPRSQLSSWQSSEAHVEPRAVATDKSKRLSDGEIRRRIIAESIDAYPGNCPCPYNTASNGSRCGRRSAYDREGGYAPLCYPRDVSDEMVAEYRKRLGN